MVNFDELKLSRREVEKYCESHNIKKVGHEYHFIIDEVNYIVSPHVVIVREGKGKTTVTQKIKEKRKFVYIRAKQEKLRQIYEDLRNGLELDEGGNRL